MSRFDPVVELCCLRGFIRGTVDSSNECWKSVLRSRRWCSKNLPCSNVPCNLRKLHLPCFRDNVHQLQKLLLRLAKDRPSIVSARANVYGRRDEQFIPETVKWLDFNNVGRALLLKAKEGRANLIPLSLWPTVLARAWSIKSLLVQARVSLKTRDGKLLHFTS